MSIVIEAIAEDVRRLDTYIEELWRKTGLLTRIIAQPLCTFCMEHEVAGRYSDDYESWCNANEEQYDDNAGEIFTCDSFKPRENTLARLARYKIGVLEETLDRVLEKY